MFLNSVILGLGATWVLKSGILFTGGISISGLDNPLTKVFEECKPMKARITLSNGKIYMGVLRYFSYNENITETEIVLTGVDLETKDGERRKKNKSSVLILFGKDISSIEIIPGNFCKSLHEGLVIRNIRVLMNLSNKLEKCEVYTQNFFHPFKRKVLRGEIKGLVDNKCLFIEETLNEVNKKECKLSEKSRRAFTQYYKNLADYYEDRSKKQEIENLRQELKCE